MTTNRLPGVLPISPGVGSAPPEDEPRLTLNAYRDLPKGDWIRVDEEWRKLNGEPFAPYVEGVCEYYGCETGCTGYVIYLVREGEEPEQLGGFYFQRNIALAAAEEEAEERGILLIMRRDWD